jgi:crossover junction endodeoxyribonuclease RuvC
MPKKKEAAPTEEIIFPQHYYVCGADLSLRRPGFCLLEVDNMDGKANIANVWLMSVDNKAKKNKTHGQILREIMSNFDKFISISKQAEDNAEENRFYFVREKMILNKKVPSERDVAKVVGIMDYYLDKQEWHEIYPVTIKCLIAGSGRAEKSEVATSLRSYVGDLKYRNDDESDATAVAVAWLIQNHQIKEIQK